MIPSIFDVEPRITSTPTPVLRNAIENLKRAGEQAHEYEELTGNKDNSRAGINCMPVEEFVKIIILKIKADYPIADPTRNACKNAEPLAIRAYKAGYVLKNPQVQEAFAAMLMAYVTEGFIGKDTTGTTMGNFSGGNYGHFDYSKR